MGRLLTRPEIPALLFLFFAALVVRLEFLFADEFARGVDGYYYAAQVKHFLERGALFGSDSSLLLRALVWFHYPAAWLGLDIVNSNKVCIALLGALLVPAGFLLGRTMAEAFAPGGRPRATLNASGLFLAAFFTSVSPVVWFHLEFVKNLAGILLFALFATALLKALVGNTRQYVLAGAWLVLTLLSHKLMGGFALIFAAGGFTFAAARAVYERSIHVFRFLLIGCVLLTGGLILLALVFPGMLNPVDFSRFENLFVWPPRFHLNSYAGFIRPPVHHLWEFRLMALAPLPAVGMLLYDLFRRRHLSGVHLLWVGLLFIMHSICMNPILRFRELDLAFRLLITLFIPAGLLLVFSLSRLPARITQGLAYALVIFLTGYQAVAFRSFPIRGKVNYALYDQITPLLVLPEDSLLIAHQSLDNFYYYREGLDAFRFMPEEKHFSRPVYRLAWGISRDDLNAYLPGDADVRFLPGRYTLMREHDWQAFTKRLPPSRRKLYRNWKNPHLYRPGFMSRGK